MNVLRGYVTNRNETEGFGWVENSLLVGECCILAWLIVTEGMSALGSMALIFLGGIGLAIAAASRWPTGAIFTLIAASALPRVAWTLFGLHLRPEHLAVAATSGLLFLRRLRGPAKYKQQFQVFDYFLIAYVILNFITSAFTSPEPRMTLRWAALNAIVIAPFFLLRFFITTTARGYEAIKIFLWIGFIESAIGIFCFFSNILFHTSVGVSAEQYGVIPGTYGTQYEANIFGSYTGCCAILFLTFFVRSQGGRRTWYLAGLIISLIASIVSLARSVLIAIPIAATFVLWAIYKSGQFRVRRIAALALILGLVLIAISPFVVSFVVERFGSLDFADLSQDSSTLTRLVQVAAGVEDVRRHPILGTGTASFQLFFNWDDYMPGMGGDTDAGGWLGNTPLRVLHDTGVVGLAFFLLFLGFLASASRKAFKAANSETRTVLIALWGGLILYAITFQATEATMLAFTWVHLGLVAAVVGVAGSPKIEV